jgi:hypothetical protein
MLQTNPTNVMTKEQSLWAYTEEPAKAGFNRGRGHTYPICVPAPSNLEHLYGLEAEASARADINSHHQSMNIISQTANPKTAKNSTMRDSPPASQGRPPPDAPIGQPPGLHSEHRSRCQTPRYPQAMAGPLSARAGRRAAERPRCVSQTLVSQS